MLVNNSKAKNKKVRPTWNRHFPDRWRKSEEDEAAVLKSIFKKPALKTITNSNLTRQRGRNRRSSTRFNPLDWILKYQYFFLFFVENRGEFGII